MQSKINTKFKNIQLAESLLMGLGAILHSEMRHMQTEAKDGPLSHRSFAKLMQLSNQVSNYSKASRDLVTADTLSHFNDADLDAALELATGKLRQVGLLL